MTLNQFGALCSMGQEQFNDPRTLRSASTANPEPAGKPGQRECGELQDSYPSEPPLAQSDIRTAFGFEVMSSGEKPESKTIRYY